MCQCVDDHKTMMCNGTLQRLESCSTAITAQRQVHRDMKEYFHGPSKMLKDKRELMSEDIDFIVEQLKSKVASNWKQLQHPETYNKFSARSCISHKPGTESFLAVFGGLEPWLARLKSEFESEGSFWQDAELQAEMAAAAEAAEECEEVEVEEQNPSNATKAAITRWIGTHKPYKDTSVGQEEQATELISIGQQRQHTLAARNALIAQKAATAKELEDQKSAQRAIQRAARSYEVEEIIDKRIRENMVEYRVSWKDFSAKHNSWEPEGTLTGALAAIAKFEKKIKRPKQAAKKK